MSKIKLNAPTGGGSVSLEAPSSTQSNNNIEFKLPVADGSAGQFMKTDGSGNLAFAGGGGKFSSYAIIADSKASNADAGTFTSGAWRTRDLNTEFSDEDSIVSISSNQFTLGTGNYLIEWICPAYRTSSHSSRLYNVTDSTSIQSGYLGYDNSTEGLSHSLTGGSARISITGNKVFEIQHRAHTTQNNFGFGVGSSGGLSWAGSGTDGAIYTLVKIFKEA